MHPGCMLDPCTDIYWTMRLYIAQTCMMSCQLEQCEVLNAGQAVQRQKSRQCLKVKACNDLTIRSALSNATSTKLQSLHDPALSENRTVSSLTEEWSKLTMIIIEASAE